jgi:tRNA A-37 threonylcarbamoyl transferase component Bud32
MIEGALDETQRNAVEEHIDICQLCATLMIDLVAVGDATATIGRYQLRTMIGRGGMGEVWSAWDPQLTRLVAIKRVRHDLIDKTGRAQLIKEARALAAVGHPNVIAVYDAGEDHGEVFIATELIEGATLGDWQRHQTWMAIVAAWAQVARGLAAVHQRKIIHRDVKPSNIMVGPDGRARIGDFGIARQQRSLPESASSVVTKTHTGFVSGTPGFMAPELLRGEQFDERIDQFALCVGLGEVLTGIRPIAGEVIEFANCPELAAIVTRGLAIKAADRFPSMTALATQLESAHRPAAPKPKQPARRAFQYIVGIVGLAAVGTTTILWQRAGSDMSKSADTTLVAVALPPDARVAQTDAPVPGKVPSLAKARVIKPAAPTKSMVPAPAAAPQITVASNTNDTAVASTALVALQFDSLSTDVAAQRAKKLRDEGDSAGCLAIVGTDVDALSTRSLIRAQCEMTSGDCVLGTQRLRHIASLGAQGNTDIYFERWTAEWLAGIDAQYCLPSDQSASVTRRLARLYVQAPLQSSLFHGPAFLQAMFDLSIGEVLSNNRMRTKLFDAYISQLLKYSSISDCRAVDKIASEGAKIKLQIDPASLVGLYGCSASLAALAPGPNQATSAQPVPAISGGN